MIASRVRYREGQRIGVAELREEQDYLLGLARRHDLALHDWGIVTGLGVEADAQGIRVGRGVAVDGFGRELIVRARLLIPWNTPEGAELRTYADWPGGAAAGERHGGIAVWLQYGLRAERGADSRANCERDRHVRWDEDPRLVFTPWVPSDPRTPPLGVEEPSWQRGVATDAEEPAWPVLLAWLIRADGDYVVDPAQCLPYVRLVAQAIESCSRTRPPESPDAPTPVPPAAVVNTRIDLARNMGAERRVFGVRTTDAAGVARDRLRVDGQGAATFVGSVTVVAAGDGRRSDLVLGDSVFDPDDVKDPAGLLCFLASPSPVARELAEDFARALAALKVYVDALSLAPQRAALARALTEVAASRAAAFRAAFEKTGHFDPGQLAGLALRRDTWAVANSIRAGVAAPLERLARLVIADLLSPHVQIATELRRGSLALEFGTMPPPAAAEPWSVYRTEIAKDGLTTRELRLEIGAPAADAGLDRQRLAIGRFMNGGLRSTFEPCLTVDAAATVTIFGALDVKGRLIEAPVKPDPADPRFVAEAVKAWASGTVGGVAAASPITIDILDLTQAKTGTPWPYKVKLTNTGADAVRDLQAFESLGINAQIVLPRPIGGFASIGAGESKTIDVTHDPLTAASGQITVAIGAIGRGSLLGLVVSAKLKTVGIVP